jgi:hypothetical protein
VRVQQAAQRVLELVKPGRVLPGQAGETRDERSQPAGCSFPAAHEAASWVVLRTRAGLPKATAPAGMSLVTTEPAPTSARSPMLTLCHLVLHDTISFS